MCIYIYMQKNIKIPVKILQYSTHTLNDAFVIMNEKR